MRMIEKWQEKVSDQVIKTEVFQSAKQFLCSIDEDAQSVFDLAFLDIGLKRMDGMELAKRLREENNHMIIVFTTADALSAPKGYEVEAFRYLVKPLHGDQVEAVLTQVYDKIQMTRNKTKNDALVISYDGESHRIWKQDIYYIEATGHYVEIHTARHHLTTLSPFYLFPLFKKGCPARHPLYLSFSFSQLCCIICNHTLVDFSLSASADWQLRAICH